MRTVIQGTAQSTNTAIARLRIVAKDARFRTEEGTLMATATPLGDPNKFTTIAHGTHRYLSPLSAAKAESFIDRLALAPGQRVLDVGVAKRAFFSTCSRPCRRGASALTRIQRCSRPPP